MKILRNVKMGLYTKISILKDQWEDFVENKSNSQTCILILKL